MKKLITVIVCAVLTAHTYALDGLDSLAIGQNAGLDAENINRTVFIGAGAGAYAGRREIDWMFYPSCIDSNLFIGAASALRGQDLTSCVGMGHYAFRRAEKCHQCVGIGDLAFAGAVGATNEVNINNQLFISPTNFWIFPQGNIGYFSNFDTLLTGMKNVLWVNGTVYATSIDGTVGDIALHPLGSQIVDDQGRTLYSMRNLIEHVRSLQTRIEALEQAVYSPNPMMMSAPPPSNTSTNAPPSGD